MSHSHSRPSPGRSFSFMPAVDHSPCSRKRRAPSSSEHAADECRPPSPKRHKPSPSAHRHYQPSPGFWDRISQVQLSRQVLREFDHRTRNCRDRATSTALLLELPEEPDIKRLQRFARRGGPVLTHLRGFALAPFPMSASSGQSLKRSWASSRTRSTKTSKTTPYSGQYEQALIDAHVYPEGHDYDGDDAPVPTNYEDILRHLSAERASLSPSRFTDEDFRQFKRTNAQAPSETRMMQKVLLKVLLGISGRDDHLKTETDVEFNHIKPFNKDLAAAKPDLYDGVAASKVDKKVRDQLGDLIIPSTNTTNPIAPNFFFEAKSEKGRADVAKKQACHDGAIGARAVHSLQNYGADEVVYDGKAYSFTSTFHNGTGTLQMYTSHPTAPQTTGEQADYHMTQVKAFAMTSDRETFQKGATYYRNARDLAGAQRESFIEQANRRAAQMPADTPSSTHVSSHTSLSMSVPLEGDSDTSVDELALSPARSKRPRHGSTQTRRSDSVVAAAVPDSQELVDTQSTQDTDTSFRTSRSQRQTPSITRSPTEVTTYQAKLKQKLGRSFERGEQLVFVPDEEWQPATMSGRAALFNDKYNVYWF
ncbi:hypothetical protein PMZ80_011184 [Knufia obscura]|uniref:DUF7924 domain-containing protein n=1 Tax=Knufia obscura TaxID=1635080 RepID=A0ABR0R7I5_9EURO|nr:hypothetical protein PMZ80_011184 [Knufia obscura]